MKESSEYATKWFRLDNAAKIYPSIMSPDESCVFRISANLTETVKPEVLQQALEDCKPRFPSMFVKLKKGFFWNYLEHNEKRPQIKPENYHINQHVDRFTNNGYYFTVFYYQKRISLEFFHSLSDGGGAAEFLKTLLFRYFELLGYPVESEGMVLMLDEEPNEEEFEDSFKKNQTDSKYIKGDVKKAYHMQGTHFPIRDGIALINGRVPTSQLKAVCKKYNCSITQYLDAVLIYSIWQYDEAAKTSKNPINISIPANMRGFFGSRSLRNFSLFFHTVVDGRADLTFEKILQIVKGQFAQRLNKEWLQKVINSNVAAEKILLFRMAPLFMKMALVRAITKQLGNNLRTCTLSNMGRAVLPKSMMPYIVDFECILPVGNKGSHNVALVTYEETTAISISRSVYETTLERIFFRHLVADGIDVEIQSNLREKFSMGARHAVLQ